MTHETPTKVTTEVATTLELHEEDLLSPLLFSLTSNCVDSPPPCGLDDEEAPLCVPTRYLYPPPIRDVVNRMHFSSYYVLAEEGAAPEALWCGELNSKKPREFLFSTVSTTTKAAPQSYHLYVRSSIIQSFYLSGRFLTRHTQKNNRENAAALFFCGWLFFFSKCHTNKTKPKQNTPKQQCSSAFRSVQVLQKVLKKTRW